ncbi:MAG TPA: FtsW/RodA/SpoVE family cell cycle protein, partial [Saprospiraceae bacterium]|nr:FtsW/RodA/SpoVE family cell cycle protein [Saprospiraceae bacterium]
LRFVFMLGLAGAAVIALIFALGLVFPDFIRSETWITRITDFFGSSDGEYQVQQAKIAIASGEFFGLGPGNSLQRNYLPYAYADCIYAIICEEYGMIGGIALIGLYLWLLFRSISLVTRSPRAFGAILSLGLALNIVIQAFANIAVSVQLVPATGLTLPMVSMGGTSLIFTCISIGIILSVSRFVEQADIKKNELIEIEKVNAGTN